MVFEHRSPCCPTPSPAPAQSPPGRSGDSQAGWSEPRWQTQKERRRRGQRPSSCGTGKQTPSGNSTLAGTIIDSAERPLAGGSHHGEHRRGGRHLGCIPCGLLTIVGDDGPGHSSCVYSTNHPKHAEPAQMLPTFLLGQKLREIGEDDGDGPSNPGGHCKNSALEMALFFISCPSALHHPVLSIIQTLLKRLLLTPRGLQTPSPPSIKHPSMGPLGTR